MTTPTIVFVHGAFCDASSWNQVLPLLQEAGYPVSAVQLPLTGLADDIARTQSALASITGPVMLVGHSYGGAVITGAGNASNVVGLVYIAAYAPAAGENLQEINSRFAATEGQQYFTPGYVPETVWIKPEAFPHVFAADVDPIQAAIMVAVQRPTALRCLLEKTENPAWEKRPSWYLVSEQDLTINPDAERSMAQRAHATTRAIAASHASLVSRPHDVADLILEATHAI